jgi:hypothetical protein
MRMPLERAIDGEVLHQHIADAAAGTTADGHSMAGVEVIVQDGNVGSRRPGPGADGDIVVARVDVAMRDGDIRRRNRVYAVGIACRAGVIILTPQAVNPFESCTTTWWAGESARVMR